MSNSGVGSSRFSVPNFGNSVSGIPRDVPETAPSSRASTPDSRHHAISDTSNDPLGAIHQLGTRLAGLPAEIQQIIKANVYEGKMHDTPNLLQTIKGSGLPLSDLPVDMKRELAGKVGHDIFETAEKLRISPADVLQHTPSPIWRLNRMAISLGSTRSDDELTERLSLLGKFHEGEGRWEAHPRLGFPDRFQIGTHSISLKNYADDVLNAPFDLFKDLGARSNEAARSEVEAILRQAIGLGPDVDFGDAKNTHLDQLLGAAIQSLDGIEPMTTEVKETIQQAKAISSGADKTAKAAVLEKAMAALTTNLCAQSQEASKEALSALSSWLENAENTPARVAILAGLRCRLETLGENRKDALSLYQSQIVKFLPPEGRADFLLHQMISIKNGESIRAHLQEFETLFAETDASSGGKKIASAIQLNRDDLQKAKSLFAAPVHLLVELEESKHDVQKQENILDKLERHISRMNQPHHGPAKEAMLVMLGHCLKTLGSDELKHRAIGFLNHQMDEIKRNARRNPARFAPAAREVRNRIFDDILAVLKGITGVTPALQGKMLRELSRSLDMPGKRAIRNSDVREARYLELSEKLGALKGNKRDAIKLLGKGISQKKEVISSRGILEKPVVGPQEQIRILANMLGCVGEMNSVETQRQVLAEFVKAMNGTTLDEGRKKELMILLGKAIPTFHFSQVDSGRNMQHKAYRVLTYYLNGDHKRISRAHRGDDTRGFTTSGGPNSLSKKSVAEIIEATASSLESQSVTHRPGKRRYLALHSGWTKKKIDADFRDGMGMYLLGGAVTLGALPVVDAALAATTPYLAPRPPIQNSLTSNFVENLSLKKNKSTTAAERLAMLDFSLHSTKAWKELIAISPFVEKPNREKIWKGFSQMSSTRDLLVKESYEDLHGEISRIHSASFTETRKRIDEQINEEIAVVRKAATDKNNSRLAVQDYSMRKNLRAMHDPETVYPTAISTAAYMGKKFPLSAQDADELIGEIKAERESRLDKAKKDLVASVVDGILANHSSGLSDQEVAELKNATEQAAIRTLDLYARMKEEIAGSTAALDREIAILKASNEGKGRFSRSKAANNRRIDALQREKQAKTREIEDRINAEISGVPFPHLEKYKTVFAPVNEVFESVVSRVTEGQTRSPQQSEETA